jgi:hypothetical protein
MSAIWILPLLGLDFICTDLESWTDEIFKTLLAVALTKVCRDFAVLTSWLALNLKEISVKRIRRRFRDAIYDELSYLKDIKTGKVKYIKLNYHFIYLSLK